MKYLLGLAALATALASTAYADGMPEPYTPPVTLKLSSWTGPYVGLHAGWAELDSSGVHDNGGNPGPTDLSRFDLDGAIVGGQVGYNLQMGQFVVGVEADATAATKDDQLNLPVVGATQTLTSELKHLVSIRGRLGWTLNNWMLFGTAGWAYAEYDFGAALNPFPGPANGPNRTVSFDKSGAVYGGGVEHAWQGVTFRVEYLHYDVGTTKRFAALEVRDADVGDFVRFDDVDVVRAGINIQLIPRSEIAPIK